MEDRAVGGHMTPEEFRRRGRQAIDWIADYYERIETFPVLSRVKPGEIRAMLPADPPETGEEFDAVLADLDRVILPGITHWQAPGFFAYFPANASGPSILGELLSAGLGVQGMLWSTSPACTELETHLMDWLVGMLGLPERFRSDRSGGGVIQDTASSAALCALHAARERAPAGGRPLAAYASAQAHSSIEKGIRVAGIGRENLRLVPVDDRHAMRPDLLAEAIDADRRAGKVPFFVCATIGTTSSHAIDPLPAIGPICRREDLWLHVDAAMAGTAAICPEHRWILGGLESADSFCFNPHKWMFTNFDCDCFWVADRKGLIDSLSILPDYLRNRATESGAVIDYRDWHIPLGRRFRALKLWLVIRHYGVEGLRRAVREHVRIAQDLAGWIEADPRFELVVPPPLNLVCFRLAADDGANQRLLEAVNDSGRIFLTQTRLGDRMALRMSVGGTLTRRVHVRDAWDRIRAAAAAAAGEAPAPPR